MTTSDFVTLQEITSQTAAWAEAIERAIALAPKIGALEIASQRQVICVGCGSTYYLALSAAALLQARTGVVARAFPASELLLYPDSAYADDEYAFSSPCRARAPPPRPCASWPTSRPGGAGTIVVVTNDAHSPIAANGDIVLVMTKGQERSVAQTRSFASMHVAAAAIADLVGPAPLRDAYAGRAGRLRRQADRRP